MRFGILLAVVGCSGTTSSSCLDQFPATSEADFASDGEGTCAVAPTATTTSTCPPTTRADVEAQCADAGAPCDGTIAVGHDAAVCVAQEAGLADGLSGLRATLLYHNGYQRPVWNVQNTLVDQSGSSSGEAVTVDAATGDALETTQWQAMY